MARRDPWDSCAKPVILSISRQMLLARTLLTGTLLAMAAGAQAQGFLGYVSGVPTGDALYVAVGNRIETVRYIGIRRPEILHPTLGREPYEEIVREANRQLVEGKWVTLILDAQPRDRLWAAPGLCVRRQSVRERGARPPRIRGGRDVSAERPVSRVLP